MKDIKITSITFEQEPNSCSNADIETLYVDFHDGGGGYYPVLRTEEWAFDKEDLRLFRILVGLCKRNDRIEDKRK